LVVYNYIVTSNHIHLLVEDNDGNAVPNSMHLIAGRVAQEYNQRKQRKGAFWEDRYHATAVDTDSHLSQCLTYIDMNMVRAGVVKHPQDWPISGYVEIQRPKERYGIIDHKRLSRKLNCTNIDDLQRRHTEWLSQALENDQLKRDAKWSQSIAVGSEAFVTQLTESLIPKAGRRVIVETKDAHLVREVSPAYKADFDSKMGLLRHKNTLSWELSHEIV